MTELHRAAEGRVRYLHEKQTEVTEKLNWSGKIGEIRPADFVSQDQFRENLRAGLGAIKDGMRGSVGEAAAIVREEVNQFQFAATKFVESIEAGCQNQCEAFAIPYAAPYRTQPLPANGWGHRLEIAASGASRRSSRRSRSPSRSGVPPPGSLGTAATRPGPAGEGVFGNAGPRFAAGDQPGGQLVNGREASRHWKTAPLCAVNPRDVSTENKRELLGGQELGPQCLDRVSGH